MNTGEWKRWLPRLKRGFHGIFDVYQVPANGKGRRVEVLKRYQKVEEKYHD